MIFMHSCMMTDVENVANKGKLEIGLNEFSHRHYSDYL